MNLTKIATTIAASAFVVAAAAGCSQIAATPEQIKSHHMQELGDAFTEIPSREDQAVVCSAAQWFPDEVHATALEFVPDMPITVAELHDEFRAMCLDVGILPTPSPPTRL
jgi:hypothetical protein